MIIATLASFWKSSVSKIFFAHTKTHKKRENVFSNSSSQKNVQSPRVFVADFKYVDGRPNRRTNKAAFFKCFPERTRIKSGLFCERKRELS